MINSYSISKSNVISLSAGNQWIIIILLGRYSITNFMKYKYISKFTCRNKIKGWSVQVELSYKQRRYIIIRKHVTYNL